MSRLNWLQLSISDSDKLHATRAQPPPGEAVKAQVMCGAIFWLRLPDISSDAVFSRCRTCCRRAGVPFGNGDPKEAG